MTEHQIAKTLNDFFSNTIKNLGIPKCDQSDSVSDNANDDTLKAILKHRKHPSILTISNLWFLFSDVTLQDVYKEIKNVGTTRASQDTDISTKTIREYLDIFSSFFFFKALINHTIEVQIFPKALKSANVVPVFKNRSKNPKKNYRHVSILSRSLKNLLCLFIQMHSYFKNVFSKYQCEFRQGFSAQYCLMS